MIIVNDNSQRDPPQIISWYMNLMDIKIVNSTGKNNPGTARQTGLDIAKCEWVTFIDSDDCITPSSLSYVVKHINNYIDVLHTKTIYYESGMFNKDTIEYSDMSCGGNFYKRQFLIDNSIRFHPDLPLVEDQYFNELTFMLTDKRKWMDYPVYEVHHDIDKRISFAMSNWVDYLCRYRLLYKQFITDKTILMNYDFSINEYMDNLIFCYWLCQGLGEEYDYGSNAKYWQNAIQYFKDTFKQDVDHIIDHYKNNKKHVKNIKRNAIESVGGNFKKQQSFKTFIKENLLWQELENQHRG